MKVLTIEKNDTVGHLVYTDKLSFSGFKPMYLIDPAFLEEARPFEEPKKLHKKVFAELKTDFFDLMYSKNTSNEIKVSIRICSCLPELNYGWKLPNWNGKLQMKIEEEMVYEKSNPMPSARFRGIEFQHYPITLDILMKMSSAKEIHYFIAGENKQLEGVWDDKYIKLFKAFYNYCVEENAVADKIVNEFKFEVSKLI